MPTKSVRAMSAIERRHHSLSARLFHAVLILSLILSIVAIAFGFGLYSRAVQQQYTEKAGDLARTVSVMVDSEAVDACTSRARAVFDAMPGALRERQDSGDYMTAFAGLEDEAFGQICGALEEIRAANGLASVYIGVPDAKEEEFLVVLGASGNQDGMTLGRHFAMEKEYTDAFEALNDTLQPLATFIPALIIRTETGYVCTGSVPVVTASGQTVGSVVVNISMDTVVQRSKAFLRDYCLLMIPVMILLTLLVVRRQKRVVVRPIRQLTRVAEEYIRSKVSGVEEGKHFSDLRIRTGDEIEELSLIMADMETDIRDYVEDITAVTAEKERIGTELNVASQIQEGMLPSIFPAFPDRPEFDIYAAMHPAKEVGGDFYDFFLVDDDHLAMVMADVSGKGVPAALFMMASKILINNYAVMEGSSPARILEMVNHSICLNNAAEMFVTVWLGILELSTGRIRAANAGHEYPALRKAGGSFEFLKDAHGLVVGGMDGTRYKEYEIRLEPGDALFLYTDGVTEATNAGEEAFGPDRLLEALNRDSETAPAETELEIVKREIDRFVGDAPQFDDITMLCLRYLGEDMKRMTIKAAVENLNEVLAFVDEQLEAAECPMKTQMQIDVAVEEIFVNIAHYAYAPGSGNAVIGVRVDEETRTAVITFADNGIPYDPTAAEDPDVSLPAEERDIGGLGIFMVKKSMDTVRYEYKDGQNILTLTKKI